MKLSKTVLILLAGAMVFAQDDFPIKDFTRSPTEHIINRIDDPFVVRSVSGVVTLHHQAEPLAGVLLEIEGQGTDKRLRKSISDESGRFHIRGVPSGTYYFKATRNGFQSVIGTLIVSRKAPKGSAVKIEMHVGV